MLQVIGATDAGACSLVVDDYIPLSWRCTQAHMPLYWRTGDLQTSLLEIGLVPESGMLCTITIVTAGGCLCPTAGVTADYLARAQRRNGLPCCATDPWLERIAWPDMSTWEEREGAWMFDALQWKGRFVDAPGPFAVSVGAEGVSVWLGDPLPLAACYVTPTLQCGVGPQADLRLLHFTGLDADARQRIIATITATA